MLEVIGVSKSFKSGWRKRSITPLKEVNLFVGDGEKVGVFGKSGQGKSTLANIICGFLKPDSGNVYLDEIPLYDEKCRYDIKAGKKIQIIPQQPYQSFDPMQKVGRAVEEALLTNSIVMDREEARNTTIQLFERVALDSSLSDRLPVQLSGGQIQRVAIARALAVKPEIIISDESTAMLDSLSQAQIVSIYDKLVKEDDISVIFISHDWALIKSFADRCYALTDGKLFNKELI